MQDRCQHPDCDNPPLRGLQYCEDHIGDSRTPNPPRHRAGRPSVADKEWAYVVPTEPTIDARVPHKRKRKG